MKTFATLFSGGEGAGIGLQAAGLAHLWGVEYDARIAAVAQANGFDVRVADVRDVDFTAMPRADWLHASPPCTRASVANSGAGESDEDISMARAAVRALNAQQPHVFTLENVWAYRKFKAFLLICQGLNELGYLWDFAHVNAADLGVPQTRRRLILRASRGLLPPLPRPASWKGWYAAIEDLLPPLPQARLAPWQAARLPAVMTKTALYDIQNAVRSATVRSADEPATTISTSIAKSPSHLLAVLLDGQQMRGRLDTGAPIARDMNEQAFTLSAARSAQHRVVSLTPRALARLQSAPDWYELPASRTLAAKIIGNMVPPLLMQRIAENMLGAGR